MKQFKRVVFVTWLTCFIFIVGYLALNPELLSAEYLAHFINQFEGQLLLVYILITIARGLFLIPSTPFVLAGILLFPIMPWVVFTISLAGVLLTATALYYFADILGFSEKLERKYPEKLEVWHKRLNSPKAALIVVAWSFFPFVPTDLICYVAGIVKMPFKYMILGVFIGEAVLIYFYIFFGSSIVEYFLK